MLLRRVWQRHECTRAKYGAGCRETSLVVRSWPKPEVAVGANNADLIENQSSLGKRIVVTVGEKIGKQHVGRPGRNSGNGLHADAS